MDKLLIFNGICLAVIFAGVFLLKKYLRCEKGRNVILLLSALVTIVFHYSSFLYLLITGGEAMAYLKNNPNLLLPIYPCNVVMWGCLIFGLLKNKLSKVGAFLADYLFWFGIFSTLVGMFANVDFIRNPSFADYEVTKSIVAHATMLFNILLFAAFGHVKVNLPKNMLHIFMSVILMYGIGIYCNTLLEVFISPEAANYTNSMFILHSPFDGIPFLTYPIIAGCSLVFYFILFSICELFAHPKGSRWISRLKNRA